jgi:hypothetical protein
VLQKRPEQARFFAFEMAKTRRQDLDFKGWLRHVFFDFNFLR